MKYSIGGVVFLFCSLAHAQTPLTHVVKISAEYEHICALLDDGSVRCWGENFSGTLGNFVGYYSSLPIPVQGIDHAVDIAAGYLHNCALIDDATVRCWGSNIYGQLGISQSQGLEIRTPVVVPGIVNAIAVAVGLDNSCAILADKTVTCWGDNTSGELGSTDPTTTAPTALSALGTVTAVAVGGAFICALTTSGEIKCLGSNAYGKLGNGSQDQTGAAQPIPTLALTGATSIAAGLDNACALIGGGAAKCWGDNSNDMLGDGSTSALSALPVSVKGLTGASAIGVSWQHACVLVAGGRIECWGQNTAAALASSTLDSSNVPIRATSISGARSIAVGLYFTCVLVRDFVQCWGENDGGQLGRGYADRNFNVAPSLVLAAATVPSAPALSVPALAILVGFLCVIGGFAWRRR